MSPILTFAITLLIVLILFWLGVATYLAAKHAAEKEYICKKCKKRFSPRKRDALGAAVSFGHKSVLVRCPHCRNKERLLPTDEYHLDHTNQSA